MRILYRLGIGLYSALVVLASVLNRKAQIRVRGYRRTFHFLNSLQEKQSKRIWFHCASLGEFEQGRPLIEKFQNDNDYEVFVSFFSPSGYEVVKRKGLVENLFYLPPDTRRNAKKLIQLLEPDICVFVKYEFWANLIFELKNKKIQLYCISGLFREGQVYFKYSFFKNVLKSFDKIFVQNEHSQELLKTINYNSVEVTGDTRFDRVLDGVRTSSEIPEIHSFLCGEKCLIIGSSWPDDEKHLYPLINDASFKSKVIIAPHNIGSNYVNDILKKLGDQAIAFSSIPKSDLSKFQYLVIDNIGMLSNLYQYGNIAYVGGAFHGSLHNILEPAAFGLPVIFGPKFNKYPEGEIFINKGIGKSVKDSDELKNAYTLFNQDLESTSIKIKDFVEENSGSTQMIYQKLIKGL